ncbi:hypothetical protein IMZ48_30305 [Candidatus Bathyarchaeota archaeon]|nr:hypothetical protein [Candidatus Bathyarchaeota archaeon]
MKSHTQAAKNCQTSPFIGAIASNGIRFLTTNGEGDRLKLEGELVVLTAAMMAPLAPEGLGAGIQGT